MSKKPVVLCILDGFGYREDTQDNAIKLANTPVYDHLWNSAPRAWLQTSGLAVGLPDGQMGNSEVGHMNIGSGRVIMQNLPKINDAIKTGALAENPRLKTLIKQASDNSGRVHLMGLVSVGGVHSHMDHMIELAHILDAAGLSTLVHALLDGRDTPPQSAKGFIHDFEKQLPESAHIVTLSGRYFAMDRDQRWDRVKLAYDAMTGGEAGSFETAADAIEAAYAEGTTDEFIKPCRIGSFAGIANGDSLLMANFRADRAREILHAFVDPAFDGFSREAINFAGLAGMVDYSNDLCAFLPSLFPAETISDSFGEVLSKLGKTQLRIAETEKYAHVTFFFNGGSETIYEGEDRILIPSPDVATYDLQPEMSAHEVTEKLVAAIDSGQYDALIVNYANPDMVGHTGVLSAAIKAVETIDHCLKDLTNAVEKAGGLLFITADHGNVELMTDPKTGAPHTAHTEFDVPVVLTGAEQALKGLSLKDGKLSDLAPTLLTIMGIDQPAAMTGDSLLIPSDVAATMPAE